MLKRVGLQNILMSCNNIIRRWIKRERRKSNNWKGSSRNNWSIWNNWD